MGNQDTPFEKLLARQRSDKDRQHLYNIRDLYGLKGSDAMWSVVMLFQNYSTLFEQIPAKIAEAARQATEAARCTAEAQAKAARAKMEHAATKAIERVAIDSANKIAGAQLFKWISGAAVSICIALVVMFKFGASSGRAEGANEGRARCERDTAAAAWANSAEGQIAHALAQAGDLRNLAQCDLPGWERSRDGQCVVRPHKGKTFAWRIPQASAAPK